MSARVRDTGVDLIARFEEVLKGNGYSLRGCLGDNKDSTDNAEISVNG